MEDSVDQHVAIWSKELDWLDPVKEAIFARLAILARHRYKPGAEPCVSYEESQ